MKETYFEYYEPNEKEIIKIWKDGYFSFDTNVLLNLYRYTDSTRNKFFKVLEIIENKSILTYQAGNEYHKNRLITINSQLMAYDNLTKFFDVKCGEIDSELNKHKKHSYIVTEEIRKYVNKSFSKIKEDISNLKKNHPDLFNEDPIKDFLTKLFAKKITSSYDNERLEKVFKEGRIRYEKEIPPGYKDYKEKKNNEESSLFGDLIIWFQIIDFAKEKKKPLIFVTDDLKEDWWNRYNGKTIGPRIELLKEFNEKTQQKILIYNADSFLTIANKQIGADIDDSTIKEIKDLRLKDERHINLSEVDNYINYIWNSNEKNDSFIKNLFSQSRNQSDSSFINKEFIKYTSNHYGLPDDIKYFNRIFYSLPLDTQERIIRQFIKSIKRNSPEEDDMEFENNS